MELAAHARGYQVDALTIGTEELADEKKALQYFYESFEHIREHTGIHPDTLIVIATRGALSEVDPESAVFETQEGMLGTHIAAVSNGVVLFPLIDGSCHRAGLRSGDIAVSIDGRPTAGMPLGQFIDLAGGPVGSECLLEILRPRARTSMGVTVVRQEFGDYRPPEPISKKLGDGVGYLKPWVLLNDSRNQMEAALEELTSDPSLRGLVLDLRDTNRTVFKGACEVADLFIESGTIGIRKSFTPDSDRHFEATQTGTLADYPLVVLINRGTAFAAELAAGALQEHERATLVGRQTAGVGSTWTALPLNDRYRLYMKRGEYQPPSGRSFIGRGIEPDVTVMNMTGDQQLEAAIDILISGAARGGTN
jgi:carboxyl-terminal processing protease